MKITATTPTYYRTRDGRKAVVLGKNPFSGARYPFIGAINDNGNSDTWKEDGSFFVDEHAYDLVTLWDEPKDTATINSKTYKLVALDD